MLSPNGRRRKTQHQTRNGQLCSRSCTTQSRHILASQTEKNQDWFDPNDHELHILISRREQAHQRVLQTRSTRSTTAAYKDACRLLQKHTRALKSDWWERKAVELQRAADRNDMKSFYSGLKEVWGPKKKGTVQLKSTDGMETSSDSKRVVARWSEQFQKLLNVPGDIDHEALDNIPQHITKTSLDEFLTMDEMARAINRRPERWQSTRRRWNSCRSMEAWRSSQQ